MCHVSKFEYMFKSAALLDDLDKELNNYIMRCREWYGWHFPELGKVITDNLAYCKTVRKIGNFTILSNNARCNWESPPLNLC